MQDEGFNSSGAFQEEHGAGDSASGSARSALANAFVTTALLRPDAIAAIQPDQVPLTYKELLGRSRRLANRLNAAGIGNGDTVAIAAPRSLDTLTAIVGVMLAGAAYMPLDPQMPQSMAAQVLHLAKPALILTSVPAPAELGEHGLAIWPVTSGDEAAGTAPLDTLPEPGADDPLYIMFTSGSTGQPKGVIVPHRAACRLVLDQDYCHLGPDEIILHAAPLAFDASTFEIWGALLNGGTLAIVPDDRPSLDQIAAVITGCGVTTAWLTAGLFHLMIDERIDALAQLRQVLAGGDVLSVDHVRRLQEAAPRCAVINGYGPTENTTFTCCAKLAAGPWPCESAPIGRPIKGTRTWIVDDALQPVATGKTGQLVTGGDGLAIGYLGDDALTHEKFVAAPDPIGERVYLTGDLARELPGGQLEFLGRLDRQIKIDGKRIEPAAIEQALRTCADVTDAAVLVETSATGFKRLIAFVTSSDCSGDERQFSANLSASLRDILPDYLWPSRIHAVDAFPLTPNGKLDRVALLKSAGHGSAQIVTQTAEADIAKLWSDVLGLDSVGPDDNFFELGGRSLQLMRVHAALCRKEGRDLPITGLFANPTLRGLAEYLGGAKARSAIKPASRASQAATRPNDIAIVGMSGRFPGARSIEQFWANQKNGAISITRFDDADLKDWFDPATRADPAFVRARGILESPADFDADLFAMNPHEVRLTDPQHRLFLEIALEALERGGLDPQRFEGSVGVFAGASMPTYLIGNVLAGTERAMQFASTYQLDDMETLVGSLPDALATRVAYKLGLHGPAMTVLSACSTSAVAIVQACQNLILHQCDAALAGGVSITFPQERGYLSQDGGMGSDDGHCRPLDAGASGTVFGSGAGVVLLKRLEDALLQGDHIHAVIRGSGIGNDGGGKGSFTAPSAEGQARTIRAAHAAAGVDPASIGYVELHGTATPLGDPIEFSGLVTAFGDDCPEAVCALGSAKSNIGHLDVAAGVTGVIKAVLCLENGAIPPLAGFERANPHIVFEGSPFRVETSLAPWPRHDKPRRAGVSSFGVGGTNVHLVLEEAPTADHAQGAESLQVLPISARTPAALDAMAAALADHIESHPEAAMADMAITLAEGRTARRERAAVVAATRGEAVQALRNLPRRGLREQAKSAPPIVFMFPGQGSQYPGMGATLYRDEPIYRQWIDAGCDLFAARAGSDLRALLLDGAGGDAAADRLRQTANAQPALFITQHALAQLWLARGVRPSAMIGHSIGEFVAATLAGVMRFEDALALVIRRGELMQSVAPGSMLAVRASEDILAPLLSQQTDIAAINAPELCVAAGPDQAIAELEARLEAAGIETRQLHTSHAFHSAMMDPVVAALEQLASTFCYAEPHTPYVSGVTGDWAGSPDTASGGYWARHCRAPVRFAAALATVVGDARPVLLEVGPGRALSTFATQGIERTSYTAVVQSMPDSGDAERDRQTFYSAAARLWACGADPDWSDLYGPDARKVILPAYQFQRKTYWIDPPQRLPEPAIAAPATLPADAAATEHLENEVTAMTANHNADPVNRQEAFVGRLAAILEDLSGEQITAADGDVPFLELGFDSLLLGRVATKVQRDFGVKLTFRQLMGDLPTMAALADHLDLIVPAQVAPVVTAPVAVQLAPAPVTQNAAKAAPAGPAGDIAAAFQGQLDAMQAVINRQLEVLSAMPAQAFAPAAAATTAPAIPAAPTLPSVAQTDETSGNTPSRFRPYRPVAKDADLLTAAQRALIADLTARTCARMPQSKAQTQQHRPYFADPRSASGFRAEWKEMVFPVVAARSKGSKIWDVDGNEYVDLVNGYGQTAFGHAPDFVTEAVAAQLEKGFAIGPQSPLAGEVAQQFSRLVGLERVTFCNTGSEAVMAAMRVARCVTGRDKVVVFNNDYHGQFDEVLVKAGGKAAFARAVPIAPGIPPEAVSHMVVLPYGAAESLDWIASNADNIAAVIAEPVQSRHPELRPFDFLRSLRALTEAEEIALVFDEVVTGFRTHAGGMQAVLGIKADMATYGKVVGGGMPVGVLAGSSRFLDALDGGAWQFGDESFPEVAPTFFAGTFVRHPLVMAACKAVLDHIEAAGPELQTSLAARCDSLVQDLRRVFTDRGIVPPINGYSSWFMLDHSGADRLAGLFSHAMRLRGVHILDGYPCFLTTAHSQADLDLIIAAAADSLDELQAAGILPGSQSAAEANAQETWLKVPLTEPQMEVLLSAQMGDDASCAFNESISLAFDRPVDAALLNQAVNAFIARHDALRSVLARGESALLVAPSLTIDLPVVRTDEQGLGALLADEAANPFDLCKGPLIRGGIVDLGDGRFSLVITAHHIVFDGWTANLFANEVAAIYRSMQTGAAPELDPALPFSAYAAERDGKAPIGPVELDYWQSLLADPPEPLALPVDRARQPLKSFKGATFSARYDAVFTQAVRKAGAKLGCTLFATLFGALQVTLGRLANEGDVIVGCPTAGQALIEDHVLAGHCVNFLPLRAPFTMETSLGDHLATVKTMVMEAFEHQDVTYGAIVRALKIPRNPNRTPLTDVQFNLERLGEGIDFGSTAATLVANPKAAVNFDLFFNMVESSDGLRLEVDYSTDLFDAETIARWTENLRQVLRALVADPGQAIGTIDLLGNEERAWISSRNTRFERLPDDATIVGRFAAAAALDPAHVAIASETGHLSYAQLDAETNRFANALTARGIGKGDRVALLAGRSARTVIAIIGILKAGAAYVPLDIAYPAERLKYVTGDVGAALVLVGSTETGTALDLPADFDAVDFENIFNSLSSYPAEPSNISVQADDPAYVMYTSGSTGLPKGVVVPHRAAVRLVTDQDFAHFGPDETFLHLAPLGFDASTLELWGALLHGGALAVVSAPKPSLAQIDAVIRTHGVTAAWFTAALFHTLVDEGMEVLRPLRQILAGGDVLSPSHVRKLQQALPHVRLVNGYGPTENTTFTACHVFSADGWGDGPVPIGVPIARTTVYIADTRMELCPRGATGELLVGGEGLSLGYLGDDALNAERFVTASFAPGERLYRTGDLARWRTDGALEFCGRSDRQIKVNGHRIEPAEIEAVLRGTAEVRDAAVIVVDGAAGTRQLHAFLIGEAGLTESALVAAAMERVARNLPVYMRPRTFLVVPALPSTDNGKLDRHALMQAIEERAGNPAVPILDSKPQPADLDPTEARIGTIWADVLGLESVARDDAIFDLGADSLQIFRIAARMADQGLPLDNRRLMSNPTLGEVAAMFGADAAPALHKPPAITPLSAYRRGTAGTPAS
ncbi:non-ribosomal peptide synthetase/type I polyketide synthase [Novosphingobium sp.]|uniref:non-ribosomal peptide synthetase/type I polyketide synthase n=1 Tax=Novosphingobium sp. TaxID=1874826 RepID=UPI0025F230AD|nr:non-ribosomal peptide synthetase/type I polyketide synthase [Novosphingobium sp.]